MMQPAHSGRNSLGVSLLQPSPLGSQLSFRNMPMINNVVDWDIARRKYRSRFGGEVERPSSSQIILGDVTENN